MRQIFQSKGFTPYFNDLDIAGSITKSQGKIITEAEYPEGANNNVLMINKEGKLTIKINDSLRQLQIEDDIIKFKEIK